MEPDPNIGAVGVTFDIVERLIASEGAGVAKTARTIDRPKSTTRDYLQSLAACGYVDHDRPVWMDNDFHHPLDWLATLSAD